MKRFYGSEGSFQLAEVLPLSGGASRPTLSLLTFIKKAADRLSDEIGLVEELPGFQGLSNVLLNL